MSQGYPHSGATDRSSSVIFDKSTMTVPFVLDRAAASPLHRQIYDRWRTGILGGRFPRGARVPSTRAFAETYGVSRVTVTAAYDQLLAEGYFEASAGSGTFVSQELPDEALRPMRVARSAPKPARRIRLSAYASRLDRIRQLSPSPHALNLSNVSPD